MGTGNGGSELLPLLFRVIDLLFVSQRYIDEAERTYTYAPIHSTNYR